MAAWLGTIFGIIGAMLVACNIGLNDLGYIFYTMGAICCLTSAIKKHDNSNIVLWGVFLSINLVGLVSYAK